MDYRQYEEQVFSGELRRSQLISILKTLKGEDPNEGHSETNSNSPSDEPDGNFLSSINGWLSGEIEDEDVISENLRAAFTTTDSVDTFHQRIMKLSELIEKIKECLNHPPEYEDIDDADQEQEETGERPELTLDENQVPLNV